MDLKDFSSTLKDIRPKKKVTFSIPTTRTLDVCQRPLKEKEIGKQNWGNGSTTLAIKTSQSATNWQDVIQAACTQASCDDICCCQKAIKETHRKMRHLLHISGRMTAGNVVRTNSIAPPSDVCNCTPNKRPETPPIVVCEKCGGYSYTGETCSDSGSNEEKKPIKIKNSPYPCCPCCLSKSDKQGIRDKFYEKVNKENNPLLGPHAEKILPFFEHGNKGKYPAIIGYHLDGSPIYGPVPSENANVVAYTAKGTPIPSPGTGGINDKSLVMGYTKEGKPIHPLPNTSPKESMAILGLYSKDKSPIIGNVKLLGGMVQRGVGKDGRPKYMATPAGKPGGKVKGKEKVEEAIPPVVKRTPRGLARDIRRFYPSTAHPHCVPTVELIPSKMSWAYKPKAEDPKPKNCSCSCQAETKLPFWMPDGFKPGAVALCVAKKIRKDRANRPMRSPYLAAGLKFKRCFCPKCDCVCSRCSQKRLEKQLKFKYDLPDSAFD